MEKEFKRPNCLVDTTLHYCPGCGHGIAHRLVCEVLEEMNLVGNTIGVIPVGCAGPAYNYFTFDVILGPHGRGPAIATGIKRALPDRTVFTYQGDGDLAAIGTSEIIHAATRGENITTIFVNNCVYGMTGGQMAPTTLPEMHTATSPLGRNTNTDGYPIRVCELLAQLDGTAYAERVALSSPKSIMNAKKAIRKGFENQAAGKGFSIIEVLSMCPTNWKLSPVKAQKWIEEKMMAYYPLGVFADREVKK
ncbi:MAG: 2-oxoglutarate oxidoreductase [Oscillospiraceae bacterium]|nr:2-oxoglutarate oxidoreductase [Oscillospiraceae bacterium]